MKLSNIFYFLFLFLLINCVNIQSTILPKKNIIIKQPNKLYTFNNKISSYLKIIRSNNIFPTLVLSLTGGIITNPSITILHSKPFIASTIITQLVMASSMVINDLYDIKIDKINNPNRPLVNGEITIKDAIFFTIILLSITQIINIICMPIILHKYLYLIIFLINIYTPILKKILFVKNLTCASIISFSVLFSGLSMYNSNKIRQIQDNFLINSFQNINIRTRLLFTSCILLFFCSLYNELLLDISDYKGDKDNNIPTIPVVYGKKISLILSISLLYFNIFITYNSLAYHISIQSGILFCLIYLPLWKNFYLILQNNYSKEIIKKILTKSTNCLLFSLLLICYISAIL